MAAFDWTSYLAVARFLRDHAGSGLPAEAACRSAVSRAYYAAFGYALRYATDYLEFAPRSRPEDRIQDHGRVRAHFRSRRRARTALLLDRLRDRRNDCDYGEDLEGFDWATVVNAAIQDAEAVFRSLPPPSPGTSEGTTS